VDTTREHDIVLHGATGFVGALVAAYLAGAAHADVRIALSGRSREKLERTRAELPSSAQGWPLVVADAADPTALAGIRSGLPLLVVSGSEDPLAGGGQLVEVLGQRYRDAGLVDVTVKLYDGARHEILNETNRDEVTSDVVNWLDAHL